jgi:hypothetical protein
LKTLETKVPFHCTKRPLAIEVMTESPSIAMAKLGPRGALPKTPFLLYSLPVMNLMNTTYLSHAHTIYYSLGKNFIEKMVDLGP